jgi:hypothetical protein
MAAILTYLRVQTEREMSRELRGSATAFRHSMKAIADCLRRNFLEGAPSLGSTVNRGVILGYRGPD